MKMKSDGFSYEENRMMRTVLGLNLGQWIPCNAPDKSFKYATVPFFIILISLYFF